MSRSRQLGDSLPLIDVGPLLTGAPTARAAARTGAQIDEACRDRGFFLVTGHGVDCALFDRMQSFARDFFGRPDSEKAAVAMATGGRAWRGWFPVGAELTSGRPDLKEGLYCGTEHGPDHPRVISGTPLHGPNRFPSEPAGLGGAVLRWIDTLTPVARAIMRGIAIGLGLDATWFEQNLTADPTILFRIFHYPPRTAIDEQAGGEGWGVAEHTDYGLLTLLAQDDQAGLEIRSRESWVAVPPRQGVLVANIGDMLDRLTEGRYRSTPHRVLNRGTRGRLSFPFFFDPSWDAVVEPLPLPGRPPVGVSDDAARRWDATSTRLWEGHYGDYLSAKVARVFPELFAEVTQDEQT